MADSVKRKEKIQKGKKKKGRDRIGPRNKDAVRDVCVRIRTSEECSGMFQERSPCSIPVEASEEAFEECSGMFQERSACLTPVGEASGGQYRVSTRTSDGIGRHM